MAKAKWLHYVGGYYDTEKFIREALKYGVARRISVQQAKGMHFGDTVILLEWKGNNKAEAFAEFIIERVTIEGVLGYLVAQALGAQLVSEGGKRVIRECGSYVAGPSWIVDENIDIADIVRKAEEIAEKEGLEVRLMVAGHLTKIYKPTKVIEGVEFFRGFKRIEETAGTAAESKEIQQIGNYKKRERKKRIDLQLSLVL